MIWQGTTAVLFGFLLLAVLCFLALIRRPRNAVVLIILIPAVLGYGLTFFVTVPHFLGWPTDAEIPKDSYMVSHYVNEPDWIYLWIYTVSCERPRAYQIPYTKETHKQLAQAAKKKSGGMLVGVESQDGEKAKKGSGRMSPFKDMPVKFKIINPVDLMPKEE